MGLRVISKQDTVWEEIFKKKEGIFGDLCACSLGRQFGYFLTLYYQKMHYKAGRLRRQLKQSCMKLWF